MDPTRQIWLVRHGETAWSRAGRHTGRTDVPLLSEAEPALKALRPYFKHAFALVLSSPLQRASQTATVLGFPSPELDEDLVEWNYGAYEGKSRDEIQRLVPGWSIWTHGVPDGETLDDIARRARKVLERVESASGDVAIFAHGHLLRILTACWLQLPPAEGKHFTLFAGALSILGFENEAPTIVRWNWQPQPGSIA